MSDLIERQAAIDAFYIQSDDNGWWTGTAEDMENFLKALPSADAVEVVRCKDCIYYDPPHVEDAGVRYEYKDMPKDAFNELGIGLVHIGYGVNVGGRCTRDYNVGYSEDKRVYVEEMNYCGRAERRTDD